MVETVKERKESGTSSLRRRRGGLVAVRNVGITITTAFLRRDAETISQPANPAVSNRKS